MRSIRTRFTTLTALAIIISVIAVGGVSARYLRKVASGYLDELMMLKCSNVSKDIDSRFNAIEQSVDTVALYAEKKLAVASGGEKNSYLDDIYSLFHNEALRNKGVLAYYFLFDPEASKTQKGFWYYRNGSEKFRPEESVDIAAYDESGTGYVEWFHVPKSEGRAMWLGPYKNYNLDGSMLISYIRPVYVRSQFKGVAGIDFDYDTLRKLTEYEGHFDGALFFLTDENDDIIVHPEYGSGTPVTNISKALGSDSLPENQSVFSIRFRNVSYRVTWSSLSNGMRLYLAAPEKSMRAQWSVFLRTFLLITLLILAAFTALSIVISGRIAGPLTKLADAAGRINQGDYDVDLDYSGDDEIGTLTNSFRQLTDHLKGYISDLNDMAYKDALTSVRNMGAFEIYKRKLDDSIKAAGKGKRPEFAFIMFDCNSLKNINDSFGHDKGDMYLKNACSLICDVFTHSPVFRIGGDEFICILQNDDFRNREELKRSFYERADAANARAHEPWEKIDLAAGMAVYAPALDKDVQDVFNRADNKMYSNKQRIKEQANENDRK